MTPPSPRRFAQFEAGCGTAGAYGQLRGQAVVRESRGRRFQLSQSLQGCRLHGGESCLPVSQFVTLSVAV